MKLNNSNNIQIFTTVSSVWSVISGLIGPFYVIHVQKLSGGMDKLGIAFSIMIFLQAATTYFIGSYSDKIGRKPFMFFTAYTDAAIFFSYTVISETYQVYILQALLGITNGMVGTIKMSFLGDNSVKEKRGKTIGKFNSIVSLASALGLLAGGYLIKLYGINTIFYLASVILASSSVFIFFIKEEPLQDKLS